MPAEEIVCEFVGCAFDRPRFNLPVIPFYNAHKVHQLAATDRIVKHMAAWTEPIGPDRVGNIRRKLFRRHDTAPSHAAGELWSINTEKTLAHLRVNSIGSDRVRGVRDLTGVEPNLHVLFGLGYADALLAQLERVRLQVPN